MKVYIYTTECPHHDSTVLRANGVVNAEPVSRFAQNTVEHNTYIICVYMYKTSNIIYTKNQHNVNFIFNLFFLLFYQVL